MKNCPVCNSRAVGKVGTDQFYCWDCFVEYNMVDDQVRIFDIAEDGSLEELQMADVDASLV